ncbi:hypothetical protein NP233_g6767 [Leucocoprinus birnbaumii]|uniref:Uncharacterized protein n=1 Tax=Leucocoprinus birnbaumii TaxID=56174 RepID=A0AAD5VQL2_9AGAR|nr:hypothetical protein NP233_g6767 [Leucocoprinus birnbaumii]
MSFFAGGGWRTTTSTVAQATTTTNTVSASRQASVDESAAGSPAERKPLLRAQTDPLVRLTTQNGSQTSLAANADPNAGRRFTFRGVARALYFMGAAAPATAEAATTPVPEESERVVDSPTPQPSPQATPDLPTKAPSKRSTLAQELTPPADSPSDQSESPTSDGSGESVEIVDEPVAIGRCVLCGPPDDITNLRLTSFAIRKSTSSSTGSTIVTEEPQSISQGLEDVLSGVKKVVSLDVDYSSLQSRVRELERENEEKSARLRLVEDAAAREKSESRHAHATEIDAQRREHQGALEALRQQMTETEAKAGGLERELESIRGKLTNREETLRNVQDQVRSLSSAKGGLEDTIQHLKGRLEEKERAIGELQLRVSGLDAAKQGLEAEKGRMKAEFSRDKEIADIALTKLAEDHAQELSKAKTMISGLQKDLANSSSTVNQLRTSLDSTTRTAEGLSQQVEKRSGDVQLLERLVSDLRSDKQSLEARIDDMTRQMKLTEESNTKERVERDTKHGREVDAERRIVRNLQSSLKSLQLEIEVKDGSVAALAREKNELVEKAGKLEDIRKSREQQIEELRAELTKADGLVRGLEETGKTLREEAEREKTTLTEQLNLLRRQFDDSQRLSAEKHDRIQQLEATQSELTNGLLRAQAAVGEKDATIQELEQKNAELEETRDDLEGRLVDMERVLADARETAQSVLKRTREAHEHEMTQARTRIQELQDELSSFITTAQQLHSSLETSQADNASARQTIKEREEDIHRLQQHASDLRNDIRSLEVKHEEAISQWKAREQAMREEKANLLRNHAVEIGTQRTAMQGVKENLERALREKLAKLEEATGENGTLRQELSVLKERSRKNEDEIAATHATLRDVTERSKVSIERLEEERAKVDDEADGLRRQTIDLQRELRERGDELERLKANVFHRVGTAMSSTLGGWFFLGASGSASRKSHLPVPAVSQTA